MSRSFSFIFCASLDKSWKVWYNKSSIKILEDFPAPGGSLPAPGVILPAPEGSFPAPLASS